MAESSDNPFDRVVGPWARVIEDMEATADEYRAAGRDVVELHPGDVTVLSDDSESTAELERAADPDSHRFGFDVVVPGDEFRRLRSALDDRRVDRYRVYRSTGNGLVLLLVAVEAGDDFVALIPAYYDVEEREALEGIARDHGLYTHVRPLAGDEVVTVEHENPAPFFPD